MKTKRISVIVFIIYILALFTNVSASEYAPVNKTTNEAYVISKDNFQLYFSGPVSEFARASQTMRSTLGNTNITLTNATVIGDQLTCTLQIPVVGGYTTLPISGNLKSSFRAQKGMNSIIVEVDGKINGYTVLLFEIVNDTQEDTFLLYPCVDTMGSVSGTPHLRIYIEDPNGMLFLLESPLPSSLQDLRASNYEQADKYMDAIYWAWDLVEHTVETVPVTQEQLQELGLVNNSRALGSFSLWAPEEIYRHTVTVGGTTTICSSLPYLNMMHVNLTNGSDSTWTASFGVAEHVYADGVSFYGINPFVYKNLEMSFGCGSRSTIIRLYQEGRMYDRTNILIDTLVKNGDDITIELLKHTVPHVNVATTYIDVLEFVNNMQSQGVNVELGSNGIVLSSEYTAAIGERLLGFEFEESTDQNGQTKVGHYFTLQAVLQSCNASVTTSTTGVLSVKFDVYNATEYYQSFNLTFPLDYTVYVLG